MNKFHLSAAFAALMLFGVGCETTDKPKEPPVEEKKPQTTAAEKKRKAMREAISDMLKIERKERKTFLSDSEDLSSKEKKVFSESWSSQHREAEELHEKVRSRHEKEKKKSDSWVFFD